MARTHTHTNMTKHLDILTYLEVSTVARSGSTNVLIGTSVSWVPLGKLNTVRGLQSSDGSLNHKKRPKYTGCRKQKRQIVQRRTNRVFKKQQHVLENTQKKDTRGLKKQRTWRTILLKHILKKSANKGHKTKHV